MFAFHLKPLVRSLGLILLCASCLGALAVEPVVHPVLVNEGSGQRLTLTIFAEGYRLSEQQQFLQDATNLVNSFFSAEPFLEYKTYFNAHAVFIESQQSGSDHPVYPLLRDTYFNSSYDEADRLVSIPSGSSGAGKVTALLKKTVPATDLSVILVNDPVYGGSGGALLVVSKSASAPEILIHEAGHTLGNLGDEYTDASQYVPTVEPPNTTRQTARNRIKWNAWISNETPVPTPANPEFQSAIGLFEGAQNKVSGWYRPKFDCRMRSLNAPFCEVCREALVKAIYGKVRPIASFTPQTLKQALRNLEPLSFHVEILKPTSHTLETQWYVDNSAIPDATNQTFVFDPSQLPKGTHSIRAEIRDATSWVRIDPAGLLKQSITWTIDKAFPETVRPIVAISAPVNNARLTQPTATITGIARDNIAVAQMLFQMNDGPFLPALGTENWSFTSDLRVGTNVLRVKSIDISGNESLPKTRVLNYVVTSPLGLTIHGNGTISGAKNGDLLEIGKTYRLNARPASAQLFLGWSGDIVSSQPALTFAMQTNLQLQATFILNPYLLLQGDYVGLFQNDEAIGVQSSGLMQLKLRNSGTFSGKLSLLESDYSFSGKFHPDKHATVSVKRANKTPLLLEIAMSDLDKKITGTASADDWQASTWAERAGQVDASWRGRRFTMSLPGFVNENQSLGDSIGTGVIGQTDLKIAGILADGARFSHSVKWGNRGFSLFWRNRSESLALGQVEVGFEAFTMAGEIHYYKRPGTTLYREGVTNRSSLKASQFQEPLTTAQPLINFGEGVLRFEGGNLPEPLRVAISLESRQKIVISGTNEIYLRLNPKTGLLSGSFRSPASGNKVPVNGVVLQNETNIAGNFPGTNQSGRILLE